VVITGILLGTKIKELSDSETLAWGLPFSITEEKEARRSHTKRSGIQGGSGKIFNFYPI
jgi:hypothetical protein